MAPLRMALLALIACSCGQMDVGSIVMSTWHQGGQFGIDHVGLDPTALALLREIPSDYAKISGTVVA